jgi:hypothetical protein
MWNIGVVSELGCYLDRPSGSGVAVQCMLDRQSFTTWVFELTRRRRGVQVDVSAVGEADFRAWEGWVHSRARTLVLGMQVCCPALQAHVDFRFSIQAMAIPSTADINCA